MEAIGGERAVHVGRSAMKAREYPLIFQRLRCKHSLIRPHSRLDPIHIHKHEAGGVPNLVGKGAVAVGAALVEGNVGAGCGHRGKGEARGIRPIFCDHFQRVQHVALGLRHLLAVGIAHQRVNVDMTERDAVIFLRPIATGLFHGGILLMALHEVAAKHNHAGQPEK